MVGGALAAGSPAGVIRISASEAERAGRAISLERLDVAGATLVELQPADGRGSLLAVAPDGRTAAVADQLGEASGTLTLAADDGAQLQVSFPGLLAASFAPDGSWLAVIDGGGALWKLEAGSGRREQVLEGPFIGSPLIDDDGSLLLLAVPSVEAPYQSRLVRLTLDTGVVAAMSDDELVYGVFPLDNGDLAIVAHQVAGTDVFRLAAGAERRVVYLGAGAVNVAVARNGRIAFERAAEGISVLEPAASAPRFLGIGSRPCFAPDGSSLLVQREGERVAVAFDGSVLATTAELSAFAGSEGCLP
jgi:hypothetical protein